MTLTVKVWWQPDEPDGSTCYHCGSPVYLFQYRLWSSIANGTPSQMFLVACGSCVDSEEIPIKPTP